MAKRAEEKAADVPGEEKRRQLLQETLGIVMTPRQAQKATENLLETLHSFRGVFAAPESILKSIPGMTDTAARLLRMVVQLSDAYMEDQSQTIQYVYDVPSAAEALRPKFAGRKTESIGLLLLDPQGRVVYNDLLGEGDFGEVPVYLRQILQLCVIYQAEEAYIAHNHPSGTLAPSGNDLLVTDRVITALRSINVELRDHIIFADSGFFSFRKNGVMDKMRYFVERAQGEQLENLRHLGEQLERDRKHP